MQTDRQRCMHTLGVKIHQINVPGLMSKIQLHRFTLHESGQSSGRGIKAKSIAALSASEKPGMTAVAIFLIYIYIKEAKLFYSV